MPFNRPGKESLYTWVYDCAGQRRQLSLGTKLEKDALRIESWCEDHRQRGDLSGILAAIVAGEMRLMEAYSAGPDAPALLARKRAERNNPDLRTHLDAWESEERKDGVASIGEYRKNVERLYPVSLRPSDLNAVDIRKGLLALPDVQRPTLNRHLTALSSFCRWCVRHGILPRNPTEDVERWSENPTRMRLWTPEEARRICMAMAQPWRGLHALAASAGWEVKAMERGRVRDLALDGAPPTAFAHGTKNPWRERLCVVTESWALPLIRELIDGREPDAMLYDGEWLKDYAYRALTKALKALKLPHADVHDWRHSHAVWLLQRGELPSVVAHQLGHKTTALVWERYGRFAVQTRHYRSIPVTTPTVGDAQPAQPAETREAEVA